MPNRNRQTELEVIQALQSKRFLTSKEIGKILGLSHKWVEDKLRILKSADRIYIADWKHTAVSGDLCRVYALKKGPEDVDVPKPPPLSNTQKSQRYRESRKLLRKTPWIFQVRAP